MSDTGDIVIRAPDGTAIRFPAGTTDETITSVMRREYGGPGGADGDLALPGFRALPNTVDARGVNTVTPQPEAPERPVPHGYEPPELNEGPQPPKGSNQQVVGRGADIAHSFTSGARRGAVATMGVPGSIEWAGRAGIDAAARFLGQGDPGLSNRTVLPTASDMVELAAGTTPRAQEHWRNRAQNEGFQAPEPQPFYQPQSRPGRYANTIGEFTGGAILPVGRGATAAQQIYRRLVPNVALPGAASEAAGEATAGTRAEPVARVAAALLAPYAPRAVARLATPLPTTAARTGAANTLAGEGVDLTAGQRTGNRPLRFAESTAADTPFAGSNIPDILERQGDQFSRAALRRVGETADDVTATPRVLADARARIGAEIERLAANNDIVFRAPRARTPNATAQAFERETLAAEAEYNAVVPVVEQRNPHVHDLVDELNNLITNPGHMFGGAYQAHRSRWSQAAHDARASDPQLSRFYAQIRDALDNAMEAGLTGADAAAWRTARQQWRHLMVLEDAMAGAGEATALGQVVPAQLARASRSGNRQAYAEDRAPFSNIAHAGAAVMTPMPNSGTPARLMTGGTNPTALLLGSTIGRAVGSPTVQGILANQHLARPLNWMGPTRPQSRVGRALMLPGEMQGTLSGE